MELNSSIKMFSITFPIVLGITGIFYLALGMRGILTKRPFMISNRWLLANILVVAIPLPLILLPLLSVLDSSSDTFIHSLKWLNVILWGMILFVIVMFWYSLRGYVAHGVTDVSFRESLLAALEKLQFPYEESLSAIRLTAIEADLQVSVQAWIGSGIIKVKQRRYRSKLKEIVGVMNEDFRRSSVSIKMTPFICMLVIGIFEVLFAAAMFFLLRHLGTLIA